eukprot:TRINITY_DN104818_c0_g1_i1.p1 TRINITY_DN104818_c0_g1~~TRINITY_DN104818_c0_g1_i1.p1  ORF type:complete len:132 (-),score=1.56 TRINITY_DN104818_c0_g1_i1:230-625(-)
MSGGQICLVLVSMFEAEAMKPQRGSHFGYMSGVHNGTHPLMTHIRDQLNCMCHKQTWLWRGVMLEIPHQECEKHVYDGNGIATQLRTRRRGMWTCKINVHYDCGKGENPSTITQLICAKSVIGCAVWTVPG